MTYTTEQLIGILDDELKASWKGERIVLSSPQRLNNPVLAKALGTKQLSKVFAYRDFRAQIHHYQQQHEVSGLIWREFSFAGVSIRFPEVHPHLIPICGDKEILITAKASVLSFWREVTKDLQYWLVGDNLQLISAPLVGKLSYQAEWAELEATRSELYLGLCWGNPHEHRCSWAQPHSGCEKIIAAPSEPSITNF